MRQWHGCCHGLVANRVTIVRHGLKRQGRGYPKVAQGWVGFLEKNHLFITFLSDLRAISEKKNLRKYFFEKRIFFQEFFWKCRKLGEKWPKIAFFSAFGGNFRGEGVPKFAQGRVKDFWAPGGYPPLDPPCADLWMTCMLPWSSCQPSHLLHTTNF